MAGVVISGLRKSFGRVEVLRGIDLAIEDGEFVAILGESGCGKSTLLRILAGLEDETAGRVEIGGRDVAGRSPIERDVAMVFQSYALYPHMSAAGNIAFPLELAGMAKDAIAARVARAAELLGLGPHLEKRPRELSGGQRQRVAMGRAIVREPEVFLFDEPLSNLDAKLRVQMRGEIRELQRRLGTTAVYVTHDQVEAMTMADRVALMRAGEVEQYAPPLELYDRPASVYVASFVGSPPMSLLSPSPAGEPARVAGTAIAFRRSDGGAGSLRLGIRPEHVLPSTRPEAEAEARLVSIENTGDRTFAILDLEGQALHMATPQRLAAKAGELVPIRFESGRWHGFDAETGRRVDLVPA